jgi:N-acetylmuramoyl-L-alanine amidase
LTATGSLDSTTAAAIGVTDNTQANTDLYLLAKLIYSEARGEPYEGQVAVGAVVLNRVDDASFPNTLQGVIYQPWAFTALHDGQFSLEPNSTAYEAAQDALNGWDPTYGCLYYYNPTTATSSWIFSRQIIVTIGNHVFCI